MKSNRLKLFHAIGIISLAINLITQQALATTSFGVLKTNETWSGNVNLLGDVTVPNGITLTILPGTIIQCDANSDSALSGIDTSRIELIVQGNLQAAGTSSNKILFTSWPVTTTPQKRDWYGLRFEPSSTNNSIILENCIIEYGVNGVTIDGGGVVTISKSIFHNNYEIGLSANAAINCTDCAFQNNSQGLFVGETVVTCSNCWFTSNETGIQLQHSGKAQLNCTDCVVSTNMYGISDGVISFSKGKCQANAKHGIIGALTSVITDSTFTENGGQGIVSYGLTVSNCVISGNQGNGVAFRSGTIIKSTISNNNGLGIAGESQNTTVIDSVITQNTGGGCYVENSPIFMSGSSVTHNGGNGVYTWAGVTITNCVIAYNADAGIRAFGLSSTNGIQGNRIIGNNPGIFMNSSTGPVQPISGNSISGNLNYEFQNQGTASVIATNNYWGEPTTSELINASRNFTKIYDSRDNANVGQVVITPYLTLDPFAVPPSIDPNTPKDVFAALGASAVFTVTANSESTLSYQWRKGLLNLNNQTNVSLVLNSIKLSDSSTDYNVIISNSNGSITSRWATLTILMPPSISTNGQPQSLLLLAGKAAHFQVIASGNEPLYYQWVKDGINLSNADQVTGATLPNLNISNIHASDAGNYWVVVTNMVGFVTSQIAKLELLLPPIITTNPNSQVVGIGSPVTFGVAATGSSPLNYQWFLNNIAISNATNANLTLPDASTSLLGSYQVQVWNSAGTNWSSTAGLWIDSIKLYAGVNVYGPVGSNCVVQYTTNLTEPVTWISLQSLTVVTNPMVIIDFDSPDQPKRFYRTFPQ